MTDSTVLDAVVRRIRSGAVPELRDAVRDGSGIRLYRVEANATSRLPVPTPPGHLDLAGNQWRPDPGSVEDQVLAIYRTERDRLLLAQARADAIRSRGRAGAGPDEARPVVAGCELDSAGQRFVITVSPAWSPQHKKALADLERDRRRRLERDRLARGPADVQVTVPLGADGRPDLDALPHLDPSTRVVVLEALAGEPDPPAGSEQDDAIARILGNPPSPPGEAP